jgi:hypothetical protein
MSLDRPQTSGVGRLTGPERHEVTPRDTRA